MNNPNSRSVSSQQTQLAAARAPAPRRPARRSADRSARSVDHPHLFATGPVQGSRTRIAVVRAHGEWHVQALQPLTEGELILPIEGELVAKPSRHSVQVDEGLHVEIPEGELPDFERVFDLYPWRFLNHSCSPSARVQGRELLATRSISAWEEVTFDYNTTEEAMASPFVCRCGHCGGRTIGGFGLLSPADQERLRPNLAPHLLRRLVRPPG
jgi:SET domain